MKDALLQLLAGTALPWTPASTCFAEGDDDDGDPKSGTGDDTSLLDHASKDARDKGGSDDTGKDAEADEGGDDKDGKPDAKAEPGERPAWLKDDKFWDDEKGIKTELLHNNLTELQTKFSRGESKAPKEASHYEHGLTEDQAKDLLIEGEDGAPDPLLNWAQHWAHGKGLSQADFKELVGGFAGVINEIRPEPDVYDPKAEIKSLGPNGQQIVDAVFLQGQHLANIGVFNDRDVIEYKIANGTADGVRMMQKVFEHFGDPIVPVDLPAGDGLPSKNELAAMTNDPKYDTDAAFRAKVDGLYDKMYGKGPAGSSRVMAG